MIFLTVGTQLPFDRFVAIVDRIAPSLPEPIFAQVGFGAFRPANLEWRSFVGPIEFERLITACTYVISHAGIGTLVMAQKHRKPMILFPRRAVLNEHRNDHQLATVRALDGRPGIQIAYNEEALIELALQSHPLPELTGEFPERERLCRTVATLISAEQHRLSKL